MSDWQVEQQMTEIEQLKQQLAAMTAERDQWETNAKFGNDIIHEFRQQLATVTQERNQYRRIFDDYEEPHRTPKEAEYMWNSLKQQLATAQARMQRQREILTSLVTVVGHMKVPQTNADAALQLLIVGPVFKSAQDFLEKEAQP